MFGILLSVLVYDILDAGKQMTSRSLSYTANAGFFDGIALSPVPFWTGRYMCADYHRGRIWASLSWAKKLFCLLN